MGMTLGLRGGMAPSTGTMAKPVWPLSVRSLSSPLLSPHTTGPSLKANQHITSHHGHHHVHPPVSVGRGGRGHGGAGRMQKKKSVSGARALAGHALRSVFFLIALGEST